MRSVCACSRIFQSRASEFIVLFSFTRLLIFKIPCFFICKNKNLFFGFGRSQLKSEKSTWDVRGTHLIRKTPRGARTSIFFLADFFGLAHVLHGLSLKKEDVLLVSISMLVYGTHVLNFATSCNFLLKQISQNSSRNLAWMNTLKSACMFPILIFVHKTLTRKICLTTMSFFGRWEFPLFSRP